MNTNHRLIQEIDEEICAIKTSSFHLEEEVAKTVEKLSDLLGLFSSENDSVAYVFSNELSYENRRFICICFLRALDYNKGFFESIDKLISVKIFKLFDDVIKSDIYKRRGITEKDQNFTKENKLIGLVTDVENQVTSSFKVISNIDSIELFEKSFLQTIKSKLTISIFQYFVPNHFIDASKFVEVIKHVKNYKEADLADKILKYKIAFDSLENIVTELKGFPTYYSSVLLADGFARLFKELQRDFEKTPFIKPANLTVLLSDKKYPLHEVVEGLKIRAIIKNTGNGYAYNCGVEILDHSPNLAPIQSKYDLDQVDLKQVSLDLDFNVIESSEDGTITLRLTWNNYDGTHNTKKISVELKPQVKGIPWEKLKYEEPYSSEAVEREGELVGRTDILNKLFASVKNNVGSAYVYGQKRVGKTSIVKTLKNKVKSSYGNDFIVIYIEGGEYVDKSAETTIQQLTEKICQLVKFSDLRFTQLEMPKNFESLTRLISFLDVVLLKTPDIKVLIILDEFDEISQDLYKRTEIGNSFFLSMRALCNKPQIGFWLVGGERMEFLINCHGEQLNKFQSARVDYFDKENHLSDFKELVRKPTEEWLEFSDSAINLLHSSTSGNPFFSKIICKYLFTQMVENRDSHVTDREMDNAIISAIDKEETQIFSHFWEDAITEKGDREEEISMNRKKILLAIAYLITQGHTVSEANILDKAALFGLQNNISSNVLREFVERQILLFSNDIYAFKVDFFGKWLVHKGVTKLMTTLADGEMINQRYHMEERAKINTTEIVELIEKWGGAYKGQEITVEKVRFWLEQFGENSRQRTMFKLLSNIVLYNDYLISIKLEELYKYILKDTVWEIKEGQRKRGDILISYLDSPGKSGAEYAKLFADRNNIYSDNVVEPSKLTKALEDNYNIRALVFIDDFIGTGSSASQLLEQRVEEIKEQLQERFIPIYVGAICGFEKGKSVVEKKIASLEINGKVIIADVLSNVDKCFSDNSRVFEDTMEKTTARSICYEKGSILEKNHPFGYGDSQALIVFSRTCPNNSLPIFWKKTNSWTPLFPR